MSPELGILLGKLRKTYEAGGSKPNRIRLHRQLSNLWGEAPPVDVLLHESTDPSAPSSYRSHFARRLRNLGKVASPESREQLAGEMRATLASRPAGASSLAQALIAFNDDATNIDAVRQLLDPDSPAGDTSDAGLIAALTLSHSAESLSALWDHTLAISEDPDRHSRSLIAALPPLAREPDLDVEPVLRRVLGTSSDFPLYATAIQSCFARPPGEGSLAAIRLATQGRTQFDGEQQQRLGQLLRTGLLRWQRLLSDPSAAQGVAIDTLLNEI
ncbi:MAG: hypothetical protein ACR2RV_10580 [Verrucomicrobiales bacterium]